MTERQSRRASALICAYLQHHARKIPPKMRDATVWLYLLSWAELGGKTSEVPREFGGTA